MKKKNYKGYRSYQYLEEGIDYKPYKLAQEVNRVPPYEWDLTAEEEKRAQRLFEENIVISLHEHITVMPAEPREVIEYRKEGRIRFGYEGISVSGLDAVFENFGGGTVAITSKRGWKWTDIIYDLGMRLCDIAHQDFIIRGETVNDIISAYKNGKVAIIPSMESATPIENEIDRLDILYGFGIRSLGITYSESNTLGSGQREKIDGGLTCFGHEAVKRMNKLGILIDVAHAGDRTALDTIKASKYPVVISHTGARKLWNFSMLKPDEVLIACAERGGVLGINAAPHTTLSPNHPVHSIDSVMDHFEYCVNLVGIDHVALGPDTLFGDHVAFQNVYASQLSIQNLRQGVTYERVDYVAGMENPSECFANAVRWLIKHGYSDDEIKKVLGQNIIRVLKEVWWK